MIKWVEDKCSSSRSSVFTERIRDGEQSLQNIPWQMAFCKLDKLNKIYAADWLEELYGRLRPTTPPVEAIAVIWVHVYFNLRHI